MDKATQLKLDNAEIAAKLKGSLLLFIQAFFPILTGREFIISRPIGRESHFITICKILTKCTRLQALRVLINVPPGHGKSVIVSFWIAWCYAKWPDCNFLYISYSKTLATSHTETIKRIMSLNQYKILFGVTLREDSQAKDAFTTEAGGTVASFGAAGAVTGRNAGLPGLDRFSGAVVCFPYDEYVQTELGPIKIGDIVTKKMNIKVFSIDLNTREVQLKPIIGHFENPGSPIIEVGFSDGATIRCTPDHKIWTDNRSWVEAQNLLFSDQLPTPTKRRGAIEAIKTRDKSPIFIRHIGHVHKSYCINVQDNHNFFCGHSEDKMTIVQNCDDMHKPDEVHSDLIRESVITNFRETIQQRPRGINVPIVFIGQRLHEQDLPAYFLAGEDGYDWDKVILKSIDEAGNALYPEAFPLDMLKIRQEKDRYVFAAQHQQDPQPAGGGLFMPEDFPLLAEEPEFKITFITADTAETEDPRNDATVFSFWGLYNIETQGRKTGVMGIHWIGCREIRVEPKNLETEFLDFWQDCARHKMPPLVAFIEKKSTGVTLISVLKSMRGLKIREIERTRKSGSKAQRFIDIQPYIASKQVSLPAHGSHTEMCINHMKKITNNDSHAHDDIADTCSDAVRIALIDRMLYAHTHKDSLFRTTAKELSNRLNIINALKKKAYEKRT